MASKQNSIDQSPTISLKLMNWTERMTYIKDLVTIEPLICCVVIAKMVCIPALTNLHFEKACKVNAGYNDTVCTAILTGTYLEKNFREHNNVVQHYLTNLRSWEIPVSSVVPVILVLFVGSYSDRHKIRKPFLLMPVIGDMVSLIGCILNVIYMSEWSLEIQAICDKVIPSIFGSDKLIIMISYAYIADISSPEMRTLRMAVIPILLSVCIPIVQAISGVSFRAVGYIPIFSASIILLMVAFLNGIFMVKEPLQLKSNDKESTSDLIKDVFNVNHVVETFTLLIRYKGILRSNFLCVLLIYFIQTMVNTGEYSTFFLFTQTAYQWTVVDYSYYTTLGTLVNFVGLSVAVPLLTKVFNLNDLIIIIVAYTDTIVVSSVFVIYTSPIGLYMGRILSVLKPAGQAAARSQLTKYVSNEDIGKALSLNTVVSALATIISAQVYHQGLYEHTRKTFPQAVFLLGIALHFGGILLLTWMYIRNRNNDTTTSKEQLAVNEEAVVAQGNFAPETHTTHI